MNILGPEIPKEDRATIGLRPLYRQSSLLEEIGAAAGDAWTSLDLLGPDFKAAYEDQGVAGIWNQFRKVTRPLAYSTPFAAPLRMMPEIGDEPKAITRPEWEASEHYREGVQFKEGMTQGKAEVLAELFDRKQARDLVFQQSPRGMGRFLARTGTQLAVTALDPVNYIPIFGPLTKARAVSRLGVIGGHVVLGAAEAGIATAAMEPALISQHREYDDQVAWSQGVWDVLLGGTIGALIGTGQGVWARRKGRIGMAARKAVLDHLGENPVDVAPHLAGEKLPGVDMRREIVPDEPDPLREDDIPDFVMDNMGTERERQTALPEEAELNVRKTGQQMTPEQEAGSLRSTSPREVSPEALLVEQMSLEKRLAKESLEDAEGNPMDYDEAQQWQEAKTALDDADVEAEMWQVAAECLLLRGL